MRSPAAVLILILAAGSSSAPQDDHRVQELLCKLDDDLIEARASAAAGRLPSRAP